MKETRLFYELPGNHKFHSCILTTFSFDFHHFESQVMRMLKTKGVSNISVFADSRMLDESIGYSTGNIRAINSAYSLNGVYSSGAFHPKITFCSGANRVLVLFGSGNLTNGGLGKNHELFSGLYAQDDKSNQLSLINEIWYYLQNLTRKTKGITQEKLNWLNANSNLLLKKVSEKHQFHKVDDDMELSLLYNDETPIYQQLLGLIPAEDINEIKIYCPFYDRDGKFLMNMINDCPNSKMFVFLQEENGNPPTEIVPNKKIKFYSWSKTKRAKSTFNNFERKLHAKIFYFKSSNSHYLLLGSPNATIAAFGDLNRKAINEEFAVLYKFKSNEYIENLGLKSINLKSINPGKLIRLTDKEGNASLEHKNKSVRILGADRNGSKIIVYIEKPIQETKFSISIFNNWGDILENHKFNSAKETEFHFIIDKSINRLEIAYLQFVDNSGTIISNKQMVNDYDHLSRTNPSMENYLTLQLENKIDSEDWDDLDIVSFFYTIKNLKRGEEKKFKDTDYNVSDSNEPKTTKSLSSISYVQAIELMQEPEYQVQLSKHHHSVRIWDSIYNYFKNLEEKKEESNQDDEEDGDIVDGRERVENISFLKRILISSERLFAIKQNQYHQFLTNYTKALDKSLELPVRKISLVDICQYLIVMKTLLRMTQRTVSITVREKIDGNYSTKTINKVFLPVYGSFKELNNFTGAVFNIIGKFSLMLIYLDNLEKIEDEYQQKKFEQYQELTIVYSLFLLAALDQNHSRNRSIFNSKIWIEILASDLLFWFNGRRIDYRKEFETIAENSSIKNFNLGEALEFVNEMTRLDLNTNYFIYNDDRFGYCAIEKRIPQTNPRYYKISKPGFSSNDVDDVFMLDKLVEIQTGRLIQSKQQYQKHKKQ